MWGRVWTGSAGACRSRMATRRTRGKLDGHDRARPRSGQVQGRTRERIMVERQRQTPPRAEDRARRIGRTSV